MSLLKVSGATFASLLADLIERSSGIPIAHKLPQKMKGQACPKAFRLLPRGGAKAAPTMETALARPVAVPP